VRTRAGRRAAKTRAIVAADLGSHQMKALHVQRIHQMAAIVDEQIQGPGEIARHGRRRPEAAHIRAHDAIPVRKLRHPLIPRRAALRIAVEQEHRCGRTPGIGIVIDEVVQVEVGRNA